MQMPWMEHLGQLAAESESEDEAAEHFLPLVGMAASKLLPVVAQGCRSHGEEGDSWARLPMR